VSDTYKRAGPIPLRWGTPWLRIEGTNMTYLTRTEKQAFNTTRAKKHMRAVHYHSAFYDAPNKMVGDGISSETANILLRNGDALLHTTSDGRTFISPTKTGSRNYGGNTCLRDGDRKDEDGSHVVISSIPRYGRNAAPVNAHAHLMNVMDAMVKKGFRFSIGKLY